MEVKMKMKPAVLLVSFGTSYLEAGQKSLGMIGRDIEAAADIPVYHAYTSKVIIDKLAEEGVQIDTVEEAAHRAAADGVSCLYVISTHMIPGIEYRKMTDMLGRYRDKFDRLKTAAPVLEKEEDCRRIVPMLKEILAFDKEHEYILMGHGTEDKANVRYAQMNDALVAAGLDNVHIASVEAKPDIFDAVELMKSREITRPVILHPFMVVAGDHARNDMAGERDSYMSILEENGFAPSACIKGLGEYARFRRLYVDRLMDMME